MHRLDPRPFLAWEGSGEEGSGVKTMSCVGESLETRLVMTLLVFYHDPSLLGPVVGLLVQSKLWELL